MSNNSHNCLQQLRCFVTCAVASQPSSKHTRTDEPWMSMRSAKQFATVMMADSYRRKKRINNTAPVRNWYSLHHYLQTRNSRVNRSPTPPSPSHYQLQVKKNKSHSVSKCHLEKKTPIISNITHPKDAISHILVE